MRGGFPVKFLGTGTSSGVPLVGCACGVCSSRRRENKRLRSSVLLTPGNLSILVDTSIDFRRQALACRLEKIDCVILTHAHVDHLFGLDEVRFFNGPGSSPMPLYGSPSALKDVRRIFDYAFKEAPKGTYRPRLELVEAVSPFEIKDGFGASVVATPLPVVHGQGETYGYRFDCMGKSFAYIPDCKEIPGSTMERLRSLDLLAIDTLKDTPHPTHMCLEESLRAIGAISPRRALLTHIGHRLEHFALKEELERRGYGFVSPAYDGLRVVL